MFVLRFIKFDKLAGEYGIEKIKTIGDCYVAATGIFNDWTKSQEPTVAMVQFAQQMHLAMDELNEEYVSCCTFGVPVGVKLVC